MKKTTISFMLGTLIGSFLAWHATKEKYKKLARENLFLKKKKEVNLDTDMISNSITNDLDDNENISDKEVEVYHNLLNHTNYAGNRNITNMELKDKPNEKEMEVKPVIDGPYVISPNEFGEIEDYETRELTYYADGYLTDEDEEIIDDIESTVSYDALNQFGKYEDDAVYVRNDDLMNDYEILKDERRFKDILEFERSQEDAW